MPVYVLQIEDGLQYCCWRRRPCSAARARAAADTSTAAAAAALVED